MTCNCNFCARQLPVIRRIKQCLNTEELDVFEEIMSEWLSVGEDADYWKLKYKGLWSTERNYPG